MKAFLKWTAIALVLLLTSASILVYVTSQTPIGAIHPLFTLIKLISPEGSDEPFIQALESKDPAELEAYRNTVAEFYKLSGDVTFNGSIEEITITTNTHPLRAKVYLPESYNKERAQQYPAILYFHGGGFSSGNIDVIEKLAKKLSFESQAIVITPSYRLAPEHPFPAAFDDAYDSLNWLVNHKDTFNIDQAKIYVAGDSAGGNLAAAISLKSRDESGPTIAGQILIYPDLAPLAHPFDEKITAIGVPPSDKFILAVGKAYVGAADHNNPYHSPLLASYYNGFPPTMVITAGFDPLSTEGKAYAGKLKQAGIYVQNIHHPDLGHGFINMVGMLDAADETIEAIAAFVKRK